MRLTKYEPNKMSMFPYKLKDEELSTELDSVHKLGQLEDIEDELGIDLITLFKALKNGVYMSTKHFDIVYCECPKIIHYKCGWKLLVYGATLSLTTYGKTWALTKEELK